ncbi:TonB-dependent receptor [Flavobacterium daejeonense]|uniref:TonB-dependent receptor n=1 Tax=Flavobacterium daejeonense TaxID=350893 RepID=UPI00047B6804|nr:TonB-dependent receptor [Flavobacterium daejeonense]
MKSYLFFLFLLFCSVNFAQNTVEGSIVEKNNLPVVGANIRVVGETAATVTDSDGRFLLSTSLRFPYELEVSSVGFKTKKITVASKKQLIGILLEEEQNVLDEIVVSASRTPERIFESPVTIERMGISDVKKTASATFYDGLENLKEVQMNTSSLTFKSINTRGFATVANTRFMQLVDGMDNSSPLLNFVLGNMVGISEIDVQSVELLPGASSALYGANAFNGILFMNSKSPFNYQGITAYVKYGQTSQKAAGTNDFVDYGIRMAHAFDKHFAAKANFTYMRGTDWYATDYHDRFVAGRDRTNPNYDGVNVYGDEVSTNIYNVGQKMVASGAWAAAGLPSGFAEYLPKENVSRTGYNEVDLTDNKASNTKIDLALHFRPFGNENFEIIWLSKFGFGNAVYQGANRYYLNNFFMQQHKLEFKGKNFFLRGYTTSEDGGNSYDMLFTGINVNRAWKSDEIWFGTYAANYAGVYGNPSSPLYNNAAGAHAYARAQADVGRLMPGTAAFKAAFNSVIAEPDVLTGSRLVDNSKIYHSDANYNFKDLIKFAEIQIGGSFREYQLNSHGRIYTDDNGPIHYNEYGAYTQLMKKFMEERLKFTGSIRYDKSQNFDGNFSPRLSLVYAAGENKQHNFRASFQTGFRNPTTQDQYIGFNIGNAVLIGSAPDNLSRYSEILPVSTAVGQSYAAGTSAIMTGNEAYNNSYTASSVQAFAAFAAANPGNTPGAAALLQKTAINYVRPEEVKAFELGYRSRVKEVIIDISAYYNIYNNFIGNANAIAPLYGKASNTFDFASGAPTYSTNPEVQSLHALANGNYRVYQLYTNTNVEIKSFGIGVGLSRKVYENFEVGMNYNYAEFDFDQAKDPSFEAGFNTPKHRAKISLGNEELFKNFGFNISGRWNSDYKWESSMIDGMVKSATVIDAQMNYRIPSLKSTLKIAASNIGGKEYMQVLGAGLIGQQYFVSWTVNP